LPTIPLRLSKRAVQKAKGTGRKLFRLALLSVFCARSPASGKIKAAKVLNTPEPVPYKEKEITKLYYTISEVAALFEVNTSLIRFWEKEFDIIKPKKNKKGNRLFTTKDIENLHVIYHLVKERGFTLDGAKRKLKENPEDTIQNAEIVKRLRDIRAFLIDLKAELD